MNTSCAILDRKLDSITSLRGGSLVVNGQLLIKSDSAIQMFFYNIALLLMRGG